MEKDIKIYLCKTSFYLDEIQETLTLTHEELKYLDNAITHLKIEADPFSLTTFIEVEFPGMEVQFLSDIDLNLNETKEFITQKLIEYAQQQKK